jgi:RNA polymerase sigma factor (sigma-70 family)
VGAELQTRGASTDSSAIVRSIARPGALASLDPDQRDVLFLYAWAELSYDEIAMTLGVPLGTVRSRLSRARAQLRSHLSEPSAAGARKEDR